MSQGGTLEPRLSLVVLLATSVLLLWRCPCVKVIVVLCLLTPCCLLETKQKKWNTKQATKIPMTTPERRLSLLYATHELFRQASKDLDMDFDYAVWEDAVRALVPWTIRRQSEADKLKINKSVGGAFVEQRGANRCCCCCHCCCLMRCRRSTVLPTPPLEPDALIPVPSKSTHSPVLLCVLDFLCRLPRFYSCLLLCPAIKKKRGYNKTRCLKRG